MDLGTSVHHFECFCKISHLGNLSFYSLNILSNYLYRLWLEVYKITNCKLYNIIYVNMNWLTNQGWVVEGGVAGTKAFLVISV